MNDNFNSTNENNININNYVFSADAYIDIKQNKSKNSVPGQLIFTPDELWFVGKDGTTLFYIKKPHIKEIWPIVGGVRIWNNRNDYCEITVTWLNRDLKWKNRKIAELSRRGPYKGLQSYIPKADRVKLQNWFDTFTLLGYPFKTPLVSFEQGQKTMKGLMFIFLGIVVAMPILFIAGTIVLVLVALL